MPSTNGIFDFPLDLAHPILLTRDAGTLRCGKGRWSDRKSPLPEEIKTLYDLIAQNGMLIKEDLADLQQDFSIVPGDQVRRTLVHPLYISRSARLEHCYVNTTEGPVYIDDDVFIMEGSMLRGPLFIGKGTVVKMGTAVYGGTSIGEQCVVGGEIKNSIIDDYSNKAHHGYLGDSYIGRWCNLGAGTTVSNLKNTAGMIKVWDMQNEEWTMAGEKCGVIMGDHVKVAVNTLFNSGSVVGPFCNVFGCESTVPKFIPPLSWGIAGEIYKKEKLLEDTRKWMGLKSKPMTQEIIDTINHLYTNNT